MIPDIILRELDQRFGDPAEAVHLSDDELLSRNRSKQLTYPLAWAYTTEWPGNRYHQHPALLDSIRRIVEDLFAAEKTGRRDTYPLMKAYSLIRDELGDDADRWKFELQSYIRRHVLPEIVARRRVTCFTSANVGYGTNHLATELAGLAAYVGTFRDDDDFANMDPGGDEIVQIVSDCLRRFMDYMHADGYWAECDGPATSYNTLTAQCLYMTARELGEVEIYREKFARAAWFHAVNTMPNLGALDNVNGRTHRKTAAVRYGFMGFHPLGKSLYEKIVAYHEADQAESGTRYNGESLSFFLASYGAEEHFASEPSEFAWAEDGQHTLSDDFAIVRRKKWIASVSNLQFRPRPEGHWNLDYQTLISVYHDAFGWVVFGLNSKDDPLHATFHKKFMSFDGRPQPPHKPRWKCIPDAGRFTITDDGVELFRDYRGFEGILKFTAVSDMAAQLEFSVNARDSVYPVEATLQPGIRCGQSFQDGNGTVRMLDNEELRLTGAELGGSIRLEPEPNPDRWNGTPGRPLMMTVPDDATLVWPYGIWDPYNLATDRYQDLKDKQALLLIPLGLDSARVGFEIP